jgi:hypothetical protein
MKQIVRHIKNTLPLCIVFVIFVLCIVLSVYGLYCVCCVFYSIVLCIVVPLPPGTYPLAVNNNNNNNNNNIVDNAHTVLESMHSPYHKRFQ